MMLSDIYSGRKTADPANVWLLLSELKTPFRSKEKLKTTFLGDYSWGEAILWSYSLQ